MGEGAGPGCWSRGGGGSGERRRLPASRPPPPPPPPLLGLPARLAARAALRGPQPGAAGQERGRSRPSQVSWTLASFPGGRGERWRRSRPPPHPPALRLTSAPPRSPPTAAELGPNVLRRSRPGPGSRRRPGFVEAGGRLRAGGGGREADPGRGVRAEGLRMPVREAGGREVAAASDAEQCGPPSARGCGDPGRRGRAAHAWR